MTACCLHFYLVMESKTADDQPKFRLKLWNCKSKKFPDILL